MSTSSFSLSLRELLLLVAIAGLVLTLFIRNSGQRNGAGNPKASFSQLSPIEYRYWHQRGSSGSGTGQIGSGNEWKYAEGIEVFENFIILHLQGDVDRMVGRDGLEWFDWRPFEGRSNNNAIATPNTGH